MPNGHTDKQTLTPFRAELLRRLPLYKHTLTSAESRKIRECVLFRWARERFRAYKGTFFEITPEGAAKLTETVERED